MTKCRMADEECDRAKRVTGTSALQATSPAKEEGKLTAGHPDQTCRVWFQGEEDLKCQPSPSSHFFSRRVCGTHVPARFARRADLPEIRLATLSSHL